MKTVDVEADISVRYMGSFLCAGTSALLISLAHLHPQYWFVSLFALVPFLWRAIRVGFIESIVLGILLATSYCLVTAGAAPWGTPGAFLLNLLCLNVIFALFGILVNRVARHIGFDAVFIAVLWLPLEYGLSHYTHMGSIFTFLETGSAILARTCSLFGILMMSFLVVLINSLILMASEHIVRALCSGTMLSYEDDEERCEVFWEVILGRYWYYFVDPRAPPMSSSVQK